MSRQRFSKSSGESFERADRSVGEGSPLKLQRGGLDGIPVRVSRSRLLKQALLLGTMLSTAFGAGLPSPALAACVVDTAGGPSPDTYVCSGASTGVTANSIDATGLDVTINTGAAVGTSPVAVNLFNGPNLNFVMNVGSSIAGAGDQVNVFTLNSDGIQVWTIDGVINSTGGDAITNTLTQGGTVGMTISPTGQVIAADDAITISSLSGAANVTVTNDGQVYAGGDAITINQVVGSGSLTVNNNNIIGSAALPVGGAGVNILSAAGSASAEVNNASGASIYSAGNSVNINLLSGDATVVNEGELTSTAGRGVNVLTVTGEASATNSNSITAFSGGMVVVAGGDVDVNNDGSTISTTNGPGLSGSSLIDGNVDISNEGGSVTSTNGPGIVGFASAGDVDIESATGTVNSGGDGISGTALLSGNVWIELGDGHINWRQRCGRHIGRRERRH